MFVFYATLSTTFTYLLLPPHFFDRPARARATVKTYVEMSSDDDGDSRKGRRSNKSEDDYEDTGDCYDPREAESHSGGSRGSGTGSDGDDSIDMNSDDGTNTNRSHRTSAATRAKSAAAISRPSTHHIKQQVGAAVNPDDRERVREKGPLAGETLYEFHRRCLLRYQQIYGDMRVHRSFIVPWTDEWACEMWDVKLGNLVHHIREERRYINEDLAAIGFDYSAQRNANVEWNVLKFALQTYKSIHGDLLIPLSFAIPQESPMWPDNTWGMKLGRMLYNARHKSHITHHEELRGMGVVILKK